MDMIKTPVSIYLDLSKAFDTLYHNIILPKHDIIMLSQALTYVMCIYIYKLVQFIHSILFKFANLIILLVCLFYLLVLVILTYYLNYSTYHVRLILPMSIRTLINKDINVSSKCSRNCEAKSSELLNISRKCYLGNICTVIYLATSQPF